MPKAFKAFLKTISIAKESFSTQEFLVHDWENPLEDDWLVMGVKLEKFEWMNHVHEGSVCLKEITRMQCIYLFSRESWKFQSTFCPRSVSSSINTPYLQPAMFTSDATWPAHPLTQLWIDSRLQSPDSRLTSSRPGRPVPYLATLPYAASPHTASLPLDITLQLMNYSWRALSRM